MINSQDGAYQVLGIIDTMDRETFMRPGVIGVLR